MRRELKRRLTWSRAVHVNPVRSANKRTEKHDERLA
jgi:hypothetical protein